MNFFQILDNDDLFHKNFTSRFPILDFYSITFNCCNMVHKVALSFCGMYENVADTNKRENEAKTHITIRI